MSREGTSCKKCIHYTDSRSAEGFCKYSRHTITIPDKICSMYRTEDPGAGNAPPAETDLSPPESFKKDGRSFLLIPGIISCLLIFLICVVFMSPFELSLIKHSGISILTKVAVSAAISLTVIGFFLFVLFLTMKFRPVRIIVSVIAVVVIIFTLFNYNTLWYYVNSFFSELIEIIFNM